MQTLIWKTLSPARQAEVLTRPALGDEADIGTVVRDIIAAVRSRGDEALRELSQRFERAPREQLRVSDAEVDAACARLGDDIKGAIEAAIANIRTFHAAQVQPVVRVETQPGVLCELRTQPISRVGLYVPGGSAPLPSTVMMLAIPASLAGCREVVLCTPSPASDEILFAARACGVRQVFAIGGAQAIAAMAYGTQTIPKVDKIFGPGNAYVTEAKGQVSRDWRGAAIDMPAGPSEVLVIADESANPAFVASDLLSQAEHGPDSQVVLVTTSASLADAIGSEIQAQLADLSRRDIAEQALKASLVILCDNLEEACAISNAYAPEHLIVQTRAPRDLLDKLENAGSIFLGAWTPESVGDYASGTNHTLPTYGYARTCSSLGLADYQRRYTVQELTADGIRGLGPIVQRIAQAEGLDAHKHAVTLRLNALAAEPQQTAQQKDLS
ncbi:MULTISPECIES: histidinol dehydrogenase [Aeromonas]|jgi:histidinol dehydrogenase|uniref:Histidinol dehydrogenase n=1 Tax=Aeromonas caviae TaxID=648 RepID=A0A3N9YL93_AERCA|nr:MULTISPECIES: histidinol dehydrogenase [Aeromonas]MBP6790964.1 histidinol dehydrogenase [Aeromonas sp.]PZQ98898.1 MAG: histidinol dehydrogenase [Aeromonas media]AXB06826.1 histidinol dehydrogenase [Aeromonas caviae]AXB08470.1 histidinol dehydrogenase [Aeromonas caviae]KAB0680484.1 histidinol dehydrogenase [Aeromonas caviae]